MANNQGLTPLAIAKRQGHIEIVELLMKHGVKEKEPSRAMLLRRAAAEKDTEKLKSFGIST